MILSEDYTRIATSGRRRASLPKSRNFLRGVSLGDLPVPLQKAFNLIEHQGRSLSEQKDELSANQVVTAFQANDTLLQDEVGWPARDLITQMNAFFQY